LLKSEHCLQFNRNAVRARAVGDVSSTVTRNSEQHNNIGDIYTVVFGQQHNTRDWKKNVHRVWDGTGDRGCMIVNLLSCRSHDFTTHHLVKSYLQASRWQTIPQGSVSVPGVGGARTWFSCEVGNLQEAHACFKTITAFPRPGFFESWFWTRVKRLTFFINDAMTHTRRRCDALTWQSDKIGFGNGARYWLLTIDRDGTVVAASQINEKHRSANKTRRVSFEIEVMRSTGD